jgi:hypothetical protein
MACRPRLAPQSRLDAVARRGHRQIDPSLAVATSW